MIYLSGVVRSEVLNQDHLGVMLTPMMGNRPDLSRTSWGADTGCFAAPEKYNDERYLAWLKSNQGYFPTCLFATAPDKIHDASATLKLSLPMLPRIRQLVPVALVAQDDLEHLPIPWDEFDVFFVGGTTQWKLSHTAYELVTEAKKRGKWCHMGRVNSARRLIACAHSGYDSADGTFLARAPDINLVRIERWFARLNGQPSLLAVKEGAA